MPVSFRAGFLIAAGFGLALVASGCHASAEAGQLQMTPNQMITPADFSPVETNYYRTLDPVAAKDFIATRSFVRICQRIVNNQLSALLLPVKPTGFSVKYLLPDEPTILNMAISDYINAKNNLTGPTLLRKMTSKQIITAAELTSTELAAYRRLDADGAKEFLVTRSYVRLCQQALAQTLPIEELPYEPIGFNFAYLLPGEEALVNKAAAAALAAALSQHPEDLGLKRPH